MQSFTGLEPSRVWINHVLQLIWVLSNIVWRSHNNTQGHFLQMRRAAIMQKVKLHGVQNEKIPSSSCMRTAAATCRSWCACGRVSVSCQCALQACNLAGSCCGFLLVPLMAYTQGLWLTLYAEFDSDRQCLAVMLIEIQFTKPQSPPIFSINHWSMIQIHKLSQKALNRKCRTPPRLIISVSCDNTMMGWGQYFYRGSWSWPDGGTKAEVTGSPKSSLLLFDH